MNLLQIIASYGTVQDIEILWTIVALIGAIFSIHNLREALKDYRALTLTAKTNGRGTIARFNLKSESVRLIIQTIFFTIGILAMLIPGGDYPPGTETLLIVVGAIVRWGIILSSVLISLKSFWAWQIRRELTSRKEVHDELLQATLEGNRIVVDAQDVEPLTNLRLSESIHKEDRD